MSNKDRNKRSARKARAAERERVAEAQAAASTEEPKAKQHLAKSSSSKAAKPAKAKKTGFFGRIRNYFADVKSEMHRVTWPSKDELRNWSLGVIVALVIFGICVWLVDMGFVSILVGFTGLRG
ncbi:preprotein translocase subunit SecE [Atopobium sp. oral taxon 810]|uniref:preprotein translocase subunit SecE n=1 Tax=Atopobium sp. oral taxon 810 TaxID=712158 RepID=UPI0003960321|nr:preprotein translocase subunit SecE [Atopobium sp. oral taxon 810]ERI05812.1 preprotein translocase, SecE subunit [Atopobium sp. oral taxon 810 str. F0209]